MATNALPVLEIQSVLALLPPGRYLLPLTILKRYQPTDSSGKFFFTTASRNVSIVRMYLLVSGNHTALFCHDSQNSLNSEKVI